MTEPTTRWFELPDAIDVSDVDQRVHIIGALYTPRLVWRKLPEEFEGHEQNVAVRRGLLSRGIVKPSPEETAFVKTAYDFYTFEPMDPQEAADFTTEVRHRAVEAAKLIVAELSEFIEANEESI